MIRSTSDPGLISPAAQGHTVGVRAHSFVQHEPSIFGLLVKMLQNKRKWQCYCHRGACTESCQLAPACYLTWESVLSSPPSHFLLASILLHFVPHLPPRFVLHLVHSWFILISLVSALPLLPQLQYDHLTWTSLSPSPSHINPSTSFPSLNSSSLPPSVNILSLSPRVTSSRFIAFCILFHTFVFVSICSGNKWKRKWS